jgi:hypothetical protein
VPAKKTVETPFFYDKNYVCSLCRGVVLFSRAISTSAVSFAGEKAGPNSATKKFITGTPYFASFTLDHQMMVIGVN